MLVPENCLAFVNRTNNLELALEHGNHVFVVSAARGSAAVKVNKTLQINASRDFFRMVFPRAVYFVCPLYRKKRKSEGNWLKLRKKILMDLGQLCRYCECCDHQRGSHGHRGAHDWCQISFVVITVLTISSASCRVRPSFMRFSTCCLHCLTHALNCRSQSVYNPFVLPSMY